MTVLVTGGAGYIGSNTAAELLKSGYGVIIADNFYNSSPSALDEIKKVSGPVSENAFKFYEADICEEEALGRVFAENAVEAVIHFAGYKAVGESVAKPLDYYRNNVGGAVTLFSAMSRHGCKKLVFSSSATVYGMHDDIPDTETSRLYAINPYGRTKLMIEEICRDLCASDNKWEISLLRYYNPAGADVSGLLGENPNGIPNNLMPIIIKAANGEIPEIGVFGNDYPTPDGTCIRDYIHVSDLAKGHIAALKNLKPGAEAYNLGTGAGYSVLEMIKAFEEVNGVKVPWKFVERRPGDAPEYFADTSKAEKTLGFKAEKTLRDMCKDAWLADKNKKGGK